MTLLLCIVFIYGCIVGAFCMDAAWKRKAKKSEERWWLRDMDE